MVISRVVPKSRPGTGGVPKDLLSPVVLLNHSLAKVHVSAVLVLTTSQFRELETIARVLLTGSRLRSGFRLGSRLPPRRGGGRDPALEVG